MKTVLTIIFFIATAVAEVKDFIPKEQKKLLKNKYIVFIAHGTKCPMVQKYYPKINNLAQKFSEKQIGFALVNPSAHDDLKKIETELKEFHVTIPFINDRKQNLAKELKMTTTTQAVVYDVNTNKIRYSGAIDDSINYDIQTGQIKNDYLKDILEQLIKGSSIGQDEPIETNAFGCAITFEK